MITELVSIKIDLKYMYCECNNTNMNTTNQSNSILFSPQGLFQFSFWIYIAHN